MKETNQQSAKGSALNNIGFPSRNTLRLEASLSSDFGTYTLTYPIVPDCPLTEKYSSPLVELKASADIVEFDATEKTFCSPIGDTAKLTTVLVSE